VPTIVPIAVIALLRGDHAVSFSCMPSSRPHQARVAGYVGGEDCGKAADRGHLLRGGRFALERVYRETGSSPSPRVKKALDFKVSVYVGQRLAGLRFPTPSPVSPASISPRGRRARVEPHARADRYLEKSGLIEVERDGRAAFVITVVVDRFVAP
jgi:hypothetical protein